jgi:hypothetical protein
MMTGMAASRLIAVLPIILVAIRMATAQAPSLMTPEGQQVSWDDWLHEQRGNTAVLYWASWIPGADDAMAAADDLSKACSDAELDFVVVAVQEPLAASRTALDSHPVRWLHDRHGALLKLHRVIQLPALVIVDRNGGILARLEASPEAIRRWGPQ